MNLYFVRNAAIGLAHEAHNVHTTRDKKRSITDVRLDGSVRDVPPTKIAFHNRHKESRVGQVRRPIPHAFQGQEFDSALR